VDGRSPVATALARQMIYRNSAQSHPLDCASRGIAGYVLHDIGDGKEVLAAFLEKRAPAFSEKASVTSAILSVVALNRLLIATIRPPSQETWARQISHRPSGMPVAADLARRRRKRAAHSAILTAPTRAWNNLAAARSAVVLTAIEEPILGLK